jgi:hypothetical protein
MDWGTLISWIGVALIALYVLSELPNLFGWRSQSPGANGDPHYDLPRRLEPLEINIEEPPNRYPGEGRVPALGDVRQLDPGLRRDDGLKGIQR